MSRSKRVRPKYLVLFASLYALQGVVVAYLVNFNKNYMEAVARLPQDLIGQVQSLALLTMMFKFLGAPLSDRFNLLGFGHRKPYIVLGLIVQSVGLVGLALVDPGRHLVGFTLLAVLTVAGLGLYDTCCDGMVVDATPAEDRSRVQGILWAARFLAAMVCTLAFGAWLDQLGGARHADRLLLACAGLGLVPIVLALAVAEPRRADDAEVFQWSALRVLIRPWSLALLAFGALYGVVGLGVENNLSPFYKWKGFDPGGDVGLLGATRYLGRAVGALLLPLAMPRLGRRGVLTMGLVVLAASIGAQACVKTRLSAEGAAFVFGAANGWCDALFCVLAMEAADPRMAASTFALFMAVTNVSAAGDAMFSKAVVVTGERYGLIFGIAAVASLAALPLVRTLGRPAPKPEETIDDLAA